MKNIRFLLASPVYMLAFLLALLADAIDGEQHED